VYAIENHFFGEHITVTGLLTGQDVIAQVKGKPLGETLLLPACTLRREGDMMLDDTTPQQLEETLGTPITIVPDSGEAFLSCLLGQ
jgi:NifB/MoaA-like Fe-S oxidoreductase